MPELESRSITEAVPEMVRVVEIVSMVPTTEFVGLAIVYCATDRVTGAALGFCTMHEFVQLQSMLLPLCEELTCKMPSGVPEQMLWS